MRRGLRLRLTLSYVVVAALAVAVVAVAAFVTAERRFDGYLSDVRERRTASLVETLQRTYRSGIGWDAQAIFALSQAARVAGVNVAVYGADGRLAFTVEGIVTPGSVSDAGQGGGAGEGGEGGDVGGGQGGVGGDTGGGTGSEGGDAGPAEPSPASSPLRASSFDIRSYPVEVGGRRVATAEIYALRDVPAGAEAAYADARLRDLLAAVAAAVAAAVVVSLVVSRRLTARLEELADVVADVAAGDLDARVAPRGEDEVAALATAFNTMADALARDEEWRREMTADLAGALHAPLATIRARLAALEAGEIAPTPENLRDVGAEVDRLGHLLGALRTLNELESADGELSCSSVDLAAVAREVVSRVESEASGRAVTISVDLEPAPVRGDRGRLELVVENLLGNALKFTPAGGAVTVAVATAVPSTAVLSVRDTGPGLDPVDLPFVFDRFYRSASARGTEGVGLGLAVAKAIVDAHGGSIDAANADGGGAVFTVRLPLSG